MSKETYRKGFNKMAAACGVDAIKLLQVYSIKSAEESGGSGYAGSMKELVASLLKKLNLKNAPEWGKTVAKALGGAGGGALLGTAVGGIAGNKPGKGAALGALLGALGGGYAGTDWKELKKSVNASEMGQYLNKNPGIKSLLSTLGGAGVGAGTGAAIGGITGLGAGKGTAIGSILGGAAGLGAGTDWNKLLEYFEKKKEESGEGSAVSKTDDK